jgi:predicted permease
MTLAFRFLAKSPAFTIVAVLTLAIGLGANTAIFSAVYSILLKPLPFPESDRLVSVRTVVKRDTWERRGFSNPDFRDYRAQATASFERLAASDGANFNLTSEGETERIRGELVSHDYFSVLRTPPMIGRTFTADEDAAPDLAPLAVLSHQLWRNRFAASPDILGKTIRLTEVDYTIVGVMPADFHGLDDSTQLWVPMSTIGASAWNNRGSRGRDAVGRLKPGVTLEQARAELSSIGLKLAEQHPQTNTNYSADAVPLREEFFGSLRAPLMVLLGAVGLVLVITCVNVANLLLVRLATRRREIAVRISLGAGRSALARLFLAESCALSIAGGALGLVLAAWLLAAMKRFAPVELPHFVELQLHWPAFAFCALIATVCALAIGALPALFAARSDLNAALKDAGRTGHTGASGTRTRTYLVTAELALSLALLVVSSLFVRSFINLVSQAPGYRTEQLVAERVLLPHQRYDGDARRQFARQLLARAAALPGVRSAALASDTPLDGNVTASSITVEGEAARPAENEGRAHTHVVTREFFSAAGMTLLQGETFAASYDGNSELVAVVSQNFARRFWPKGDVIGKRFKFGRSQAASPWLRIIGVVAETKYRGLANDSIPDPDVYTSFEQRPPAGFTILLHTVGASRSIGGSLRHLVTALDPNVPVFSLATIEQRIAAATANQRFSAQLMTGFALLALLLAAIGLYGMVSFSVGQRTQEIGVRMALGARPVDILRMVLGGTGRLIAMGLVVGTVVAFLLTRFIETLLFNVNAHDPLTYLAVAAVLAVVALFAAWWPARRAARVDPMSALRAE